MLLHYTFLSVQYYLACAGEVWPLLWFPVIDGPGLMFLLLMLIVMATGSTTTLSYQLKYTVIFVISGVIVDYTEFARSGIFYRFSIMVNGDSINCTDDFFIKKCKKFS